MYRSSSLKIGPCRSQTLEQFLALQNVALNIYYIVKKKDKQTKTYTFWRLSDTEMKYITLAIVSFNSCFKGFPKLLCSR